MLVLTFQQEAGYAFVVFALYATFRSRATQSWLPLSVTGAGLAMAVLVAFPRLYTTFEEVSCLSRSSTFHTTESVEILRWFAEPVFGRCFAETRDMGNGFNVHEGLQFFSSSFAALLVGVGMVRCRGWSRILVGTAAFAILVWIVIGIGEFMYVALPLLAILALLGVWREMRSGHLSSDAAPDGDMVFHVWVFAGALAVILLPEARLLVYQACFRMDFMHSRVTGAALPSLSVLIALVLAELLPTARAASEPPRQRLASMAISAAIAGVLFLVLAAVKSRFIPPTCACAASWCRRARRGSTLIISRSCILPLASPSCAARWRRPSWAGICSTGLHGELAFQAREDGCIGRPGVTSITPRWQRNSGTIAVMALRGHDKVTTIPAPAFLG